MNVGILTYHFVSNFGANLQTLSTYKNIENAGHKPIIINWVPEDLEKYYLDNVSEQQNQAHHAFAQKYYKNITKVCRTTQDIAREIDCLEIDLVIIGSDAVFTYIPRLSRFHLCRKGIVYSKPCIDSDFPNPFWGDFISLVKRPIKVAVMSASAQNTEYKKIIGKGLKKQFVNAIGSFNYISVRDVWTQNMLSYLTSGDVEPIITPDPVFAFQYNVSPIKSDYIKRHLDIEGPYVIVSLTGKYVNNTWLRELEELFAMAGITLIGLPQTNKPFSTVLKNNLSFPIDPLDWYNIIRESVGYIGELMHPVLVSLHNSVPVYVFDKYGFKKKGNFDEESSKTYQIMKRFELESNYYNCLSHSTMPSPKIVCESILLFDRDKCSHHANMRLEEYKEMMTKILNL